MNYWNVPTDILCSPDLGKAPYSSIGIWFRVMIYCCRAENDGRIVGGATWSNMELLVNIGCKMEHIKAAHPLITIEGDDLVIGHYPSSSLQAVRYKREIGKTGGRKSHQQNNHKVSGEDNHMVSSTDNHIGGVKERKEKKEKGKSKETPSGEPSGELTLEEPHSSGTESVSEKRKGGPVPESVVINYCQGLELPASDGTATWLKWEANGWTNGGQRIKDWRGTIQSWKASGYMPSQKQAGNRGYQGRGQDQASEKMSAPPLPEAEPSWDWRALYVEEFDIEPPDYWHQINADTQRSLRIANGRTRSKEAAV